MENAFNLTLKAIFAYTILGNVGKSLYKKASVNFKL